MIFCYHLFNFGVHENHIYMILPVLYLSSARLELWKIYKTVTLTLSLVFFSAYGFGKDSLVPSGIAQSKPSLFTLVMGVCFLGYLFAFIRTLQVNPKTMR
jgi:hypothetical protein